MKAYYYKNHKGESQSLLAFSHQAVLATGLDDYDYSSVAFYDEHGTLIRTYKAVSNLIVESPTKAQIREYESQKD